MKWDYVVTLHGRVCQAFQVKNEVVAGTNRGQNRNQNRFYCFKSSTYAVLFQRSKQNQNGSGKRKSFRSLRLFTEHHFQDSSMTHRISFYGLSQQNTQNAGTSPYFSLSLLLLLLYYIYKSRTYRTFTSLKIVVPSSIRKVNLVRTLEHLYNQGLTTLSTQFLPCFAPYQHKNKPRTISKKVMQTPYICKVSVIICMQGVRLFNHHL